MSQFGSRLCVLVLPLSVLITTAGSAQTGACCFRDGECLVLTEAECNEMGADWWLEGEVCQPNACYEHLGACCYPPNWRCYMLPEEECATHEGYYYLPGSTCDPEP